MFKTSLLFLFCLVSSTMIAAQTRTLSLANETPAPPTLKAHTDFTISALEDELERLRSSLSISANQSSAFAESSRSKRTGELVQLDYRPLSNSLKEELSETLFGFAPEHALVNRDDKADEPAATEEVESATDTSFRWKPALKQSLLFLAVQHGYAFTQPKTRRDLKGKFFRDYAASVKSLQGWEDGGRFFTNYIAHPMQGSLVGFIQIQNDPKGIKQRFGGSPSYWKSRMKALAWSAAWSTQFEIGPISQASIGNVGLHGKQTYVDLVITPTVGTGLLITEDALDRFVVENIERGTDNFYVTIGSRMVLNPTRTLANLLRFKKPWHRDRPRAF